MFKRFLKLVAFTLVVVMFVEIIPVSAVTAIKEDVSTALSNQVVESSVDSLVTDFDQELKPEIVSEITSLRTENTKTYLMSDGTLAVASYEEPVHFKDENDLWTDIDNTLVYETSTLRSNSFAGYRNKANDFSVKFAASANNDKHVEISKDEYSLSWKYLPVDETTLNSVNGSVIAKSIEPATVMTYQEEFNSKIALDNNKSQFVYENIEDNIDLEYMVAGSSVKENIILDSKQDSYVFKMKLYTENLTATIDQYGGIELKDSVSSEDIFYIPKPYMYDANMAISEEVYFTLKKDSDGYLLTITADSSWINSEDRVFPVVVDPEVESTGVGTNVTAICSYGYNDSDYVATNHSMRQVVGKNDIYGMVQNIWNITMPEIPDGCEIQEATLSTYQYVFSTITGEPKIVNLTEAEKGFDENSTRSWDWYYEGLADPTVPREIIDYTVTGYVTGTKYAKADYDVTKLVKKWHDEEKTEGWVMFSYGQQFSDNSDDYGFVKIASREYETDSAILPSLLVTYANTEGLNDFNSYKSYDIEDGGTIYVNEYTGKVSYIFNDYTAAGNRLNPTLNHVYNQEWSGVDIGYGKGFNLNVNEYIAPVTEKYLYISGYRYYQMDEDGTITYYAKIEDGSYLDNEGNNVSLTVSDSIITVTYADGLRKNYGLNVDNKYYLTSILEGAFDNANDTRIGMYRTQASPYNLYQIEDSSGRATYLTCNESGRLLNVKDDTETIKATYLYTNDYLTAVTKDGVTVTYTYDAEGRLYSINNGRVTVYITYDSEGKFYSLAQGTSVLLTAEYSTDKTVFNHYSGLEEVCVFNGYGQKITNYVTDGETGDLITVASTEYSNTTLGSVAGESGLRNNNKLISESSANAIENYIEDSSFENGAWASSVSDETVTVSDTNITSYLGAKSLGIMAEEYIGSNKFFRKVLKVPDSGRYTVSVYVKTSDLEGTGAYLYVKPIGTTASDEDLTRYITKNTDAEVNGGWEKLQITVDAYKIDTDARIEIRLGLKSGSKGNVFFDCIQVEKGEAATQYNMLSETGWTLNNCEDVYITEDKLSGSNAIKVSGDNETDVYVMQTFNVSSLEYTAKEEGHSFTLSGWGKGKSASLTEKTAAYAAVSSLTLTPAFGIYAQCIYDDGTSDTVASVSFDSTSSEWQFASDSFYISPVKNSSGEIVKTPETIVILCKYSYNVNEAIFDGVSLLPGSDITYSYDENGNLAEATNTDGTSSTLEYTENNEVSKLTDSDGVSSFYTYDSENTHQLKNSYTGTLNTNTSYDDYGNVISETTYATEIISGETYSLTIGDNTFALFNNATSGDSYMATQPYSENEQHFILNDAGNGYYTIALEESPNKYLYVSYGKVRLTSDSTSDASLWEIELAGEDIYLIRTKTHSLKYLTLSETTYDAVYLTTTSNLTESSYFTITIRSQPTKYMSTETEYSSTGQFVTSVTNEADNYEEFTYNEQTGNLEEYYDFLGTEYVYTYDGNKLTSVYADLDYDGVLNENESVNSYSYDGNRVTAIETSKQSYALSYLPDGSLSSINAGTNPLMSYTYEGNLSEKLKRVTYANGQYYEYTYDENDNISRVDYVNGTTSHYYEYTYDNTGNITEVYDSLREVTSKCYIDASGNVYAIEDSDGKKIAYGKNSNGDEIIKYIWDENSDVYTFNYDDNDELVSVTLPSGAVTSQKSDAFGRITDTEILITKADNSTVSLTEAFEYTLYSGGKTDYFVESLTMRDGTVYRYGYDFAGNISTVTKNNETEPFARYFYDKLSQLVREDRKDINKTYVYTYDNDGNILTKTEYAYTTVQSLPATTNTKTYGYSTVNGLYSLTSVDGNAITYDASGNPLTYYNGMSFTWQDGRKLASLTGAGIAANYYVYNGDGLRTKKTITEGTEQYTVEYFYEGNKLIALERTQGSTTDYMFFLYDQSDNIVGFELNSTAYYYSKNLQGDVLSILDSNGDVVVKYTYTAWGELVSVKDNNGNTITDTTSVAYLNPIRYRGYVYDDEIGMYYLQSRYYDPSISRFINADSAEYIGASGTILGSNLFAYCENNVVNYIDPTGYAIVIGGITISTGALIAIIAVFFTYVAYIFNLGGFRTSVNKAVSWAVNNYITNVKAILNRYAKIGRWAANIISKFVKAYITYNATKSITDTAKKYGIGKCKEAANAMKKSLIRKKQNGAFVTLYFPKAYRGLVVSEKYGYNLAISQTGYHYGILYNGKIYCNIYPEGLNSNIWPNKFHARSDAGRKVTYLPF